jgi:general secretion pathway protein D
LEPKVTEFEGFVEYGGTSIGISSGITASVPSGFYQPIFSTREIRTEVNILDGSTVVMGGLTREEVKEVHDKVPILGDIPLIGRLFRSDSETTQKRNLLIFVTARTVSPAGDGGDIAIIKTPVEINRQSAPRGTKKSTRMRRH